MINAKKYDELSKYEMDEILRNEQRNAFNDAQRDFANDFNDEHKALANFKHDKGEPSIEEFIHDFE